MRRLRDTISSELHPQQDEQSEIQQKYGLREDGTSREKQFLLKSSVLDIEIYNADLIL